MKKTFALLLTLVIAFTLGTAALAQGNTSTVSIGALKGPTAMGLVKLMEDTTPNNPYTFSLAGAVDQITPLLLKGDLDISAVPANLAAVLYNNSQGQIQVLAINTLGVLYLVEKGDSIQTIEDLKGKTLFASGKGATPEYALIHLLKAYGLDPEKDVTIEWKAEHAECVAALATTPGAIALLPQPFVTTAQLKDDTIRIALDLNTLWEQSGQDNGALITGVVVGRKAFIEENPDLVEQFLADYALSVAYVNQNTAQAAALIGQMDIVPAPVAEKALPYCNIVFINGDEMVNNLGGYLEVLYNQNPKAVGGQLPDEGFYYIP